MAVVFRPIREEDIPTLHRWRNLPHVAQWWHPPHPTLAEATAEYHAYMRPGYGVRAFMVSYNGQEVGYIQVWDVRRFPDYMAYVELSDNDVGVDVFIGDPARLHQGIGTQILRTFMYVHVFADLTVPACIIDPLPENAAAIRAYSKVGFQHVKTFHHDGIDVYLMRLTRSLIES